MPDLADVILRLGAATLIDELEIHWPAPSTHVEKLSKIAPNRYLHIIEGKGIV